MLEKLNKLAKKYKDDGSYGVLEEIFQLLNGRTIFYEEYYENPDGMVLKTAKFNVKGSFIDFEQNYNFPIPDLFKVEEQGTGAIHYVLLSKINHIE
jgi:hypothetical protein